MQSPVSTCESLYALFKRWEATTVIQEKKKRCKTDFWWEILKYTAFHREHFYSSLF